jgi:glycoside/pentoside/hexuronide:cation symporter, GPH family
MEWSMSASAASPSRLSLPTKLAFGVGSVAFGVKDQGFGMFLMIYYNQVLGLPAQWVGAAIAFALISDAFLDPIIGYVSDNWRSRLGRRHPFLYAAALPVAISYIALWNPPSGLSHVQLTAYLVGLAMIVRTFVALYEVPSAALIPELTSDYNERTSVISYRFFFGTTGAMGISILALSVFMRPDAAHPVGQLNPAGYVSYSIAAAVLMFGAILLSAFGTQRHVQRFPVAAPVAQTFNLKRSLSEAKATFRNRGVLPIFGAGLFGGMAAGVGASLLAYVYTFFWQLSAQQISVVTSAGIASGILGVLLATRISTRFGKRNTAVGMHLIGLTLTPAPVILRLLGWFPENGSPLIVPILFSVSAIAAACAVVGAILWYSMTADVVEDAQLNTGRRSEGLLFAANAFVLKCVSGIGLGMGGFVLGLVAFPQHAVPGAVAQGTLNRLVLTQIGLVAVFYLLAIACLAVFPISRATHQANLRRLGRTEPATDAANDANPPPPSAVPDPSGASLA